MQQSAPRSGELHTHSAFSGIDVDSVLDGRRTLGKVLTNTFFTSEFTFLLIGIRLRRESKRNSFSEELRALLAV